MWRRTEEVDGFSLIGEKTGRVVRKRVEWSSAAWTKK